MTEKDIIQLQEENKRLKEENALLKDEIAKLKKKKKKLEKEVSDAGWEREAAHADDWRKPSEMGMW